MNFDKLTRYLDSMPARGVPGCDLAVWQDHKPVYRHKVGEGRPGQPMAGDETYWLYSATKVHTMTAAMQLLEQGRMSLDDPVGRYLPAYAHMTVSDGDAVRPARTVMTIEHLMSMQGGMDYDVDRPALKACLEKYGRGATTRQIVDSFAEKPLQFDPGTNFCYSLCHDVAAAVVEVVSGMNFTDYLKKYVWGPLGIEGLTFHPTKTQLGRLAARYRWDERENPVPMGPMDDLFALSDAYESGGGGLLGDVDSYILLTDALANGGVGRTGARILKPKSIDILRANRLFGLSRASFDSWGRTGYSYALGVRTMVDNSKAKVPLGEFGWDGAAGAWTMAVPERHLAAFFAMHVMNCGRVYVEDHPTIRDLICEGLDS